VDEWMERMAHALGEEPLTQPEVGAILKLARDVAHGVERKGAPLATFLAGLHAGRQAGAGLSRREALAQAVEAARDLIPPRTDEGSAPAREA
jgi:Domain of unknown function (DUF6457)